MSVVRAGIWRVDNGVGFGSEAHRRQARARTWPVLPLAAVGWWAVGALPWVVDGLGARSPREWASDVESGSVSNGYLSLLPFTTARLGLLLTVTLVGGLVAACAVIWVRPRAGRRFASAGVAVLGALSAAAYTVAQSAGATRQLGSDFDRDDRVLVGVLAVAVAGTVAGLALGLVVVLGRPVWRAFAAAPLAVAVWTWVDAVVVALPGVQPSAEALRWTPYVVSVLVGVALATVGVRTVQRVLVWPLVLVLVAVCTAASTAFGHLISLLRPRSGLPAGLRDHLEASRDVFLLALRPEHQLASTYAVAVSVGLVGAAALWTRHDPQRRVGGDPRPAVASAAVPAHPVTEERVDADAR